MRAVLWRVWYENVNLPSSPMSYAYYSVWWWNSVTRTAPSVQCTVQTSNQITLLHYNEHHYFCSMAAAHTKNPQFNYLICSDRRRAAGADDDDDDDNATTSRCRRLSACACLSSRKIPVSLQLVCSAHRVHMIYKFISKAHILGVYTQKKRNAIHFKITDIQTRSRHSLGLASLIACNH